MKEKKKTYPNPKFVSTEEEDKYWAGHSPIEEGYVGEIQVAKQKRSSFLTIRFTGDELTKLRDLAEKKGLGPSTYIRAMIKDLLDTEASSIEMVRKNKEVNPRILQHSVRDKTIVDTYKIAARTSQFNTNSTVIREQVEVIVKALASTGIFDQMVEKVCARIIDGDARKSKITKKSK